MSLSYTQLAKMTAGASGGLVVTNAVTSASTMVTSGPQSTLGRTMRVGVPLAATAGILYGLPENEYTQGAAVGSALVAVSQLMSMATMMISGGQEGGGNGTEGLGTATATAAMGGGVPSSQALSRGAGMQVEKSQALLEEEAQGASNLEMD